MSVLKKGRILYFALLIAITPKMVFAENVLDRVFTRGNNFLMTTVGGGMMLLSVIFVGLTWSVSSKEAKQRAINAFIGGLIIVSAPWIVSFIQDLVR